MISTTWCSGKGKTVNTMKRSVGCQGLEGRDEKMKTGGVQDNEAILYDTVMVDTMLNICQKLHNCTTLL